MQHCVIVAFVFAAVCAWLCLGLWYLYLCVYVCVYVCVCVSVLLVFFLLFGFCICAQRERSCSVIHWHRQMARTITTVRPSNGVTTTDAAYALKALRKKKVDEQKKRDLLKKALKKWVLKN